MKNRKILTVNEEKIIEEVKNCSKKFESILKNKKNKMDKFNYI